MKIEINLPSIGIGLASGLALASLPLSIPGAFAYSWENLPVIAVSAAVLAVASAIVWNSKPVETGVGTTAVRERLRQKFRAVSPVDIDWREVEESLTPEEWASRETGNTRLGVVAALQRQVMMPVDPSVFRAIMAALKAAGKAKRWGLDELAARMWRAHRNGDVFDVEDYLRVMRKTYPHIDFDHVEGAADGESPFHVIRVIEAMAEARSYALANASDLLWVRLVDRRLWYAINNLGRIAYHVEGLGPIAHWLAEKEAGCPLPQPEIMGALRGVEAFFDERGIEMPWQRSDVRFDDFESPDVGKIVDHR